MRGEPEAIVCMRTEDARSAHRIYQPSGRMRCSQCKHEVWVAPSTQRFLAAKPKLAIWCNECAMLDFSKPLPADARVVPGAIEEIIQMIKGGQ